MSIRVCGGKVGAGETRCELIMGILVSTWEKGMVLWATASIGRWFLTGGTGLGVSSEGKVHRREAFCQST